MKQKMWVPAGLCLAVALGTSACTSDAAGGDASDRTFVLGVANGQSGYLAGFDNAILAGVKDEVKRLNSQGGLAGKYKIRLDVKDMRSDIGEQATATQALVDAGADALILACDSDPSIAGGQVAQRARIPAFGCPSSPSTVGNFLFQAQVPERINPAVLAQYAADQGWKRAFTLGSPDTAYTQTGVEYFKTAFEDRGGSVVRTASFGLDQQDFSTLVEQIKAENPDLVETTMYEPNILAFLKQLRGAGVDVPVLGDALETAGVAGLSAKVRGSLTYTAIADTNAGTTVGDYLAGIAKTYGRDNANVYAVVGHDVVAALDAAVRAADTTDPVKVRDALARLTFEGISGKVSYDWPGSDNTQLRTIYVKEHEGAGKTKVLWSTRPDPSELPEEQSK